MAYHVNIARRRGLGSTPAPSGGAVQVNVRGDATAVRIQAEASLTTPPRGYNATARAQLLRYPVVELNALNGYDSSGTLLFPNADLKIMSQRELDGACDDVMKKVFLIDLYERARSALRALVGYEPLSFEQKAWYEAAQGWMEVWCRATAIRGGTFRAAMSETRLLPVSDDDGFAPFPESSIGFTGGGDGQNIAWTLNTLGLSGWTAKKVLGTPRDFFGFTTPWDVPDARETPYLCWPPAGPDEQYFGFPIWGTIVFDRYRNVLGPDGFARRFMYNADDSHRGAPLIENCGSQSPFSKYRGSLTGQRIQPLDVGTLAPLPKRGAEAPSSQRTMPTDVTNCMGSIKSGELRQAVQDLRTAIGLTGDLDALATGTNLSDDKEWLWLQTGTDPLDAYVAVLDAGTTVGNTSNPFDTFYKAVRYTWSNPLPKIHSDIGGIYWQTGKVATGKMMCDALRPRMQEIVGLEFMQTLATSLTQYTNYLQMPDNKAVAGESADQIAAAANAAAQAGVQTAAQITIGIGAGIAAFAGVGTIIGGIVAGIGALMAILGGLIHAQAYAPVPLWYRVLSHCKGSELAAAGAAAVKAAIDRLQLQIASKTAAAAQVGNSYLAGLKGDGATGSTKTWKLAAYTVGGIVLAGFGALVVRRVRDRKHAQPVNQNRRRRRSR